MHPYTVVGISGKRGAGKDVLAKALRAFGWYPVKFADELKKRCRQDFGLTEEQTDGALKEQPTQYRRSLDRGFYTPRDIMIRCGFYYRDIDPLFWVKKTYRQIEILSHLYDPCRAVRENKFVISDVRFKNEANYIKEHGGYLVRLERDPALSIYKGVLDDPSETELDNYPGFDLVVPAHLNEDLADIAETAKLVEGKYGRPA